MRLYLVLGLLLLTACTQPQQPDATPSARPAQLPIQPTKIGQRIAPTPKQELRGPRLPGRLVFVTGGNLWLWEKDSARQLTYAGDAAQPALSPDGSQIVFVQRYPSASNLALLSLNGGEPQPLTNYASELGLGSLERVYESMWAFYPSFSPDGTQIAFASQAGPPAGSPASEYRLSIFLIDAQPDSSRNQIFAEYGVSTVHPVFTPDGRSLLFAHQPDANMPPRIYTLDLESYAAQPFASTPEQSYDPAVSPDGRWLAYAARTDAGTSVFLRSIAASSTQAQRVGDFIAARAPAFSPDGKHIAFLASIPGERGFDLWFADLEQDAQTGLQVTQVQRITSDLMIDADSGLSWR